MRIFSYVFLLFVSHFTLAQAQSNCVLAGTVTGETGEALPSATVYWKEVNVYTQSDENGNFCFTAPAILSYPATLVFTYTGYTTTTRLLNAGDAGKLVTAVLSPQAALLGDVIVRATRHAEKITFAPASVRVIGKQAIQQTAFQNPMELASKVQGVEFVRSGVNGIYLNARGFNNANNAKVLQMTDGRISMLAGSNGLPVSMMNTVIKEDIEQIEITLGPNSALYGPNAHNGVISTTTLDPRKHEGTTVALGVGNREMFTTRLRHAQRLNKHWAYKITGEHSTGEEFHFVDSVFAGGGVYGQAVTIPEKIKTYQYRHLRGEGHVYYTVKDDDHFVLSYGKSHNTYINVSNLTRNQGQGWAYSYLQLRYASRSWFAQVYETWTTAGNTYGTTSYTRDYWNRTHSSIRNPSNPAYGSSGYLSPDSAQAYALRIGNRFKENSRRFNGEVQYNHTFQPIGLFVIASASYQRDDPNTYGSIIADKDHRLYIDQYGMALQLEQPLPGSTKLMAASRVDHHSLFGNWVSPKVALSHEMRKGSIRLSWAKAFSAPLILYQRASLFGTIFGNGNGILYIPNGAPIDGSVTQTTTPLLPEQIRTTELGYKGNITSRLYVDVNAYYGTTKNFLSPGIAVGGRALGMGNIDIPLSSLAAPGQSDGAGMLQGASFSSYFNYGKVNAYGADVMINYSITPTVNTSFKYSWFDSDITNSNIRNDANRDGYVSREERSLNAPHHKLSAGVDVQQLLRSRFYFNASLRWVQQYDMYSGNQIGTADGRFQRGVVYGGVNPINGQERYYLKNYNWGPLGGFTSFDVSAGYPFKSGHRLSCSVANVFNTRQIEFLDSPSIGRLIMVELVVHIPKKVEK